MLLRRITEHIKAQTSCPPRSPNGDENASAPNKGLPYVRS